MSIDIFWLGAFVAIIAGMVSLVKWVIEVWVKSPVDDLSDKFSSFTEKQSNFNLKIIELMESNRSLEKRVDYHEQQLSLFAEQIISLNVANNLPTNKGLMFRRVD